MLELWVPLSNEGVPITSPRYGKIPDMDVGGDMTGAHNVHGGNGKLTGPAAE